jgi:hypothetical protein
MARAVEAMRAELLALGLATDDELRRLKVTVYPPSATVHPLGATVHPLRLRRPKDAAVEAKLLEAYVTEAAEAEAAGAPGPRGNAVIPHCTHPAIIPPRRWLPSVRDLCVPICRSLPSCPVEMTSVEMTSVENDKCRTDTCRTDKCRPPRARRVAAGRAAGRRGRGARHIQPAPLCMENPHWSCYCPSPPRSRQA